MLIILILAAGRAELRRTQLTRSSRRHIEGGRGLPPYDPMLRSTATMEALAEYLS